MHMTIAAIDAIGRKVCDDVERTSRVTRRPRDHGHLRCALSVAETEDSEHELLRVLQIVDAQRYLISTWRLRVRQI